MNVSTKSEYGLRALIYLASNSGREAIPAREIAARWNVPVKYPEQILKTLKESGLVTSQMGIAGGFRFGRPAPPDTAGGRYWGGVREPRPPRGGGCFYFAPLRVSDSPA